MSEPVLTLTGICKSYNPGQANEVRVLQSCDLTLMPWQVTSLVAPSGSGKSTLLHLPACWTAPTVVSCRFLGGT